MFSGARRIFCSGRVVLLLSWVVLFSRHIAAETSSSSFPSCTGYIAHLGDSYCDEGNNNAECGYDGGDCCPCTCVNDESPLGKTCGVGSTYNCVDPGVADDCSATPSPAAAYGHPDCTAYMYYYKNELCNDDLNNAECGYDGGDCCRCTCQETSSYYNCGYSGFDCLDPDAPTDCDTQSPTPSPAAAFGYPDCTGYLSNFENGYCNWDLNTAECGYDGGDCCRCTCSEKSPVDDSTWAIYSSYECGAGGYDCNDPDAATDCPTNSPTPSPASALGYPDCAGNMQDLQDGFCDWDLNNDECGFDGGDCCICTCAPDVYSCDTGSYGGYDCQDPDAPVYCTERTTPSPASSGGYVDCTGDLSDLNNGYCDWHLNNEECGFDGGDCCSCTCESGRYPCDTGSYGGYDCQDPTAPTYCSENSTPSSSSLLDYPDCTGPTQFFKNGHCDLDLNSFYCGFDGGDCCSCTCETGLYTCGSGGYACLDLAADCAEPSTSFTDDTSETYRSCSDSSFSAGDGYCNDAFNIRDCGYDGGDCCESTCTSDIFACGRAGFDCVDPATPGTTTESTSDDSSGSSVSLLSLFIILVVGIAFFCAGYVLILKPLCCKDIAPTDYKVNAINLTPWRHQAQPVQPHSSRRPTATFIHSQPDQVVRCTQQSVDVLPRPPQVAGVTHVNYTPRDTFKAAAAVAYDTQETKYDQDVYINDSRVPSIDNGKYLAKSGGGSQYERNDQSRQLAISNERRSLAATEESIQVQTVAGEFYRDDQNMAAAQKRTAESTSRVFHAIAGTTEQHLSGRTKTTKADSDVSDKRQDIDDNQNDADGESDDEWGSDGDGMTQDYVGVVHQNSKSGVEVKPIENSAGVNPQSVSKENTEPANDSLTAEINFVRAKNLEGRESVECGSNNNIRVGSLENKTPEVRSTGNDEVNSGDEVDDTGLYTAEIADVTSDNNIELRRQQLSPDDTQDFAEASNEGGRTVTDANSTNQDAVIGAPHASTNTANKDGEARAVNGSSSETVDSAVDESIDAQDKNQCNEAKADRDASE